MFKLGEGRPSILDLVRNGDVKLIINTVSGHKARADEKTIRTTAVQHRVPCITTISGAEAAINGIESIRAQGGVGVKSLQEYHQEAAAQA